MNIKAEATVYISNHCDKIFKSKSGANLSLGLEVDNATFITNYKQTHNIEIQVKNKL